MKQEQRVEDLQKQNKMLHEQMEQLNVKMAAIVQEQAAGEGMLNISFNEEDKSQEQILEILRWMSNIILQSSSILTCFVFAHECILYVYHMVLIFIRFVRREKEIAEAQFEVAQVETQRYQQRMEHLEKELKEVQDSLTAERDKLQVKSHKMCRWYSDASLFMVQIALYCIFWSVQMTTKAMAQQEEKLKRLESLNALTETNKMLKEEKNRLEQELQQNRAKARTYIS